MRKFKVLLIEDDEITQLAFKALTQSSANIVVTSHSSQARDLLAQNQFDIVFIDLDLEEELAGLNLVPISSKRGFYTVVLSGREEDALIEKAYRSGCQDYLAKPFNRDSLELILKKFEMLKDQNYIRDFFIRDYITQDKKLIAELQVFNEIVVNDRPIYISGETGTGKTKIAKIIHALTIGDNGPFIHINCSEFSETLLESELFGHEKGSFSGAINSKKGKLALADKGTLFLDEVSTMSMALQKKLLTAIEEKRFYPVGSEREVKSEFRLISATCDNLNDLIAKGDFREDLYYRLEGQNIVLPPLRERKGDIDLLIRHFISKKSRRLVIDEQAKEALSNYPWPGNIRELEKCVDGLMAKNKGIIQLTDLPSKITGTKKGPNSVGDYVNYVREYGLRPLVDKIENEILSHFLEENDFKVRKTMSDLKLSNSSFYRIFDRLKSS